MISYSWILLPLLIFSFVCFGCNEPKMEPSKNITATVLIEVNSEEAKWFQRLEVPKGTNGYELLDMATSGNLKSDWFPEFRSHFVTSILGFPNETSKYWTVFLWNDSASLWEPLTSGADLFKVQDQNIMGWVRIDSNSKISKKPIHLP